MARYERFLLLSQCFLLMSSAVYQKQIRSKSESRLIEFCSELTAGDVGVVDVPKCYFFDNNTASTDMNRESVLLPYMSSDITCRSCVLLVCCQKKCDDIDPSACKLLEASQPDLCSNPSLSQTACPRYCNLCPLECYDCSATVLDYHECNTTTLCAKDEVCMRKELRSIVDGHHEYQMTCERKELCDGAGVTFPFGKRSVQSRDITLSCCSDDFCNYPQPNVVHGCGKDIIFMVDTSNPTIDYISTDIVSFLFHTVNQLKIGMNESLVSLYTYDTKTHEVFGLQDHTSRFPILHALQGTHFHGGLLTNVQNTNDALQYLAQHATSPKSGDRPNYRDTIVFIVDAANASAVNSALVQQVQSLSNDIIIVGVGASNGNIEQLATDNNHVFHVQSYVSLERDALSGLASQLVSCA